MCHFHQFRPGSSLLFCPSPSPFLKKSSQVTFQSKIPELFHGLHLELPSWSKPSPFYTASNLLSLFPPCLLHPILQLPEWLLTRITQCWYSLSNNPFQCSWGKVRTTHDPAPHCVLMATHSALQSQQPLLRFPQQQSLLCLGQLICLKVPSSLPLASKYLPSYPSCFSLVFISLYIAHVSHQNLNSLQAAVMSDLFLALVTTSRK